MNWRATLYPVAERASAIVETLLGFEVVGDQPLDFIFGAHDNRAALMQMRGLQFHNALGAGAGRTAGLLDDKAHRIGFIHQA